MDCIKEKKNVMVVLANGSEIYQVWWVNLHGVVSCYIFQIEVISNPVDMVPASSANFLKYFCVPLLGDATKLKSS